MWKLVLKCSYFAENFSLRLTLLDWQEHIRLKITGKRDRLRPRRDQATNLLEHTLYQNLPGHDDPWKSFDNNVNDLGKHLLEMCKSLDLRILNGRCKGDSFGKITFHGNQGFSTVDYIIVSHEILHLFETFVVREPSPFSDHCQRLQRFLSFTVYRKEEKNYFYVLQEVARGVLTGFIWKKETRC